MLPEDGPANRRCAGPHVAQARQHQPAVIGSGGPVVDLENVSDQPEGTQASPVLSKGAQRAQSRPAFGFRYSGLTPEFLKIAAQRSPSVLI
jgi:hypothetical protein